MRQPVVRENYDLVVIDTQGAKGELQRTAAMAADVMLSPLRPDVMSYTEFHVGTLEMLTSLNSMSDLSAELKSGSLCVLINCMDRTRNAVAVAEAVRADFRGHPNVRLLDTVVPQAAIYPMARTFNLPVHAMDSPNGNRNKSMSAYETMHRLIFELLPHTKGMWVDGPPASEEAVVELPQASGADA